MTKTCGMPLALPPHAALFTFEKLTGMPSTSSPSDRSSRFRLHKRFTPLVFAFYMAAIMALLMCGVIVAAKDGLQSLCAASAAGLCAGHACRFLLCAAGAPTGDASGRADGQALISG